MPPRSINLPVGVHSYQTDLGSNGHPKNTIDQNQMPRSYPQHNYKDIKMTQGCGPFVSFLVFAAVGVTQSLVSFLDSFAFRILVKTE